MRLLRSWGWVGAFGLVTLLVYSQAMRHKQASIAEFLRRSMEMQQEKEASLAAKEALQLRIASQSDPAWIEMVLMRDLGVVPDGWLKVYFKKQ